MVQRDMAVKRSEPGIKSCFPRFKLLPLEIMTSYKQKLSTSLYTMVWN